jgi:O-acetyl-ADP-ribose deacetylase (regulator of RNase III)
VQITTPRCRATSHQGPSRTRRGVGTSRHSATPSAISAGTFGFPLEAAADVALRTVRDYLRAETGIERVTFVLRPSAVETFRRQLAAV